MSYRHVHTAFRRPGATVLARAGFDGGIRRDLHLSGITATSPSVRPTDRRRRPFPISAVKSAKPPRTGRLALRSWAIAARPASLRAVAIRCVLAVAVLIPAAVLTSMLGQPFAISAIASTAAIILHAPRRYHERPQLILACYSGGIAISAAISLVGMAVGLPLLLAAAVAAVIIVATPPGRVHPPTACIPLAITAPSIQPLVLIGRWLSFTSLAAACLAILWLITAEPLWRSRQITVERSERPCTTGS